MSLTKVGEKHFSVVNHCVPRIDGVAYIMSAFH